MAAAAKSNGSVSGLAARYWSGKAFQLRLILHIADCCNTCLCGLHLSYQRRDRRTFFANFNHLSLVIGEIVGAVGAPARVGVPLSAVVVVRWRATSVLISRHCHSGHTLRGPLPLTELVANQIAQLTSSALPSDCRLPRSVPLAPGNLFLGDRPLQWPMISWKKTGVPEGLPGSTSARL